jgi:hypothetical protein
MSYRRDLRVRISMAGVTAVLFVAGTIVATTIEVDSWDAISVDHAPPALIERAHSTQGFGSERLGTKSVLEISIEGGYASATRRLRGNCGSQPLSKDGRAAPADKSSSSGSTGATADRVRLGMSRRSVAPSSTIGAWVISCRSGANAATVQSSFREVS